MSDTFYFSITSAALVLSVMALLFTIAMPEFDRWSKRFFQCYFIAFILCCLTSFADLLLYDHSLPHTAVYFLMVLECLCLSLPLPMLTVYMLHCCGETMRRSILFRAVLGLWAVFAVILISAELTGVFTYAASDHYYFRGPLYPLLLLPLVAILLLNLAGVVRRRTRFSRKVFLSFLIAIAPMTAAMLALVFADVLPLVDNAFIISALAMFVIIQNDQTERYIEKERENVQLRTDLMLSQIQPHFLYNTLGTIGHLYRNDPEAKAALIKFSDYLRGNMNSISQTEPLPFTTELKHTKTYLELEQLRFRDALTVCYDLGPTDFLLPVLTLQPLVENAVRHGVRGNDTGVGTVTIATREYPDRYEISVTDDGPGFDPEAEPEGEGAHIGIRSVRGRMRRFVGGDLKIESAPGRGCRATIIMPKEIRYVDLRH